MNASRWRFFRFLRFAKLARFSYFGNREPQILRFHSNYNRQMAHTRYSAFKNFLAGSRFGLVLLDKFEHFDFLL